MVDKEQRQALDALPEQLPFFLDMCEDGCTNLSLTNHLFVHSTYHLTFIQRRIVLQMDAAIITINLLDAPAISIFLKFT